ncbi:MAG: hypothetical protein FWG72_00565 [Oscillospiraceae bacterium]|nr:hypothetical protein [Oscillospiraceae bacterium]
MRRAASLIAAALLAALLSGCFDAENLMQAPRPAVQYQRLQGHIDALLANGYTYSAPLSGDHRQPVLMIDLTGNGDEEAVAFLRSSETEIALAVFIPRDGDFIALPLLSENAESVHSVAFHDLTGDGRLEIIVGWQVLPLRFISVYSLDDGGLTEIFTRPFSGQMVCDIEDSGTPALLLIQIDAETVEMVSFRGGELAAACSAPLSRGAEAVRRLLSSPLLDGVPGFYVTSQYQTVTGEVTDVFSFRNGVLVNISVNMETGVSDLLVRHREIPAADVNGDGVFDLPRQVELESHPEDFSGEIFYEIRWNSYESGGLSSETARTYHSTLHNWYILLPEQWPERYSVRRASTAAQTVTTFSVLTDEEDPADFLKIYFLSQPAADRPPVRGRTVLSEQSNQLVTAEIIPLRDGLTPFEMSEQELKAIFHLDLIEWRSP